MRKTQTVLEIDALTLAERFFRLNEPSIRSYIHGLIINNDDSTYPTFFRLVVRYLLYKVKLKPKEVRDLIFKYGVIFSSLLVFKEDEINDNPFKDILKEGITVGSLKKYEPYGDDPLSLIYKKGSYSKDENIGEKYKAINKVLINTKYFFARGYKLDEYLKGKYKNTPFDLLIADEAANKQEFIKFTFRIEDKTYEKIGENITDKNVGPNVDLIAFIIYEMDPFQPQYKFEAMPKIIYQILSLNNGNKMSFTKIRFIKENEFFKSVTTYSVDLSEVREFEFYFNEIKFRFSKEGIIKI